MPVAMPPPPAPPPPFVAAPPVEVEIRGARRDPAEWRLAGELGMGAGLPLASPLAPGPALHLGAQMRLQPTFAVALAAQVGFNRVDLARPESGRTTTILLGPGFSWMLWPGPVEVGLELGLGAALELSRWELPSTLGRSALDSNQVLPYVRPGLTAGVPLGEGLRLGLRLDAVSMLALDPAEVDGPTRPSLAWRLQPALVLAARRP